MLLYYAVATVHVLVSVILILVVLLQSGKGADLAGAFGGGATQTAFGSRGPASFLSRMTTVSAILFMLTSIALSMITTKSESKSILETAPAAATRPAPKAPQTSAPSQAPTPDQILKMQEEEEAKQKQQTPAPSNPATQNPASQGAGDKSPGQK